MAVKAEKKKVSGLQTKECGCHNIWLEKKEKTIDNKVSKLFHGVLRKERKKKE